MDIRYPPEAEAFREKVQAFLAEHLPAGWKGIGSLDREAAQQFTEEWRPVLHEHGYLAVSWPVEYGGAGLTPLEQVIVAEEFTKAGVPTGGVNDVFSLQMVGNTLLHWGTEEQKRHFLPRGPLWRVRLLSGIQRTERRLRPRRSPVQGRARRRRVGHQRPEDLDVGGHVRQLDLRAHPHRPDGAEAQGHHVPALPDGPAGLEVRPIKMMGGESEFCETFFTDARTPKENVVGEPGQGWAVAMTLLGYERGEAAAVFPIRFREETDRLIALAKERGASNDPVVRQQLAAAFYPRSS